MKQGLLILAFFNFLQIFSQSDFRHGYIIQNSGDTLFGEIDYRNDKLMTKVCNFRKSKESLVYTYNPGDILAYKFEKSKFFVSKIIEGKNMFLEFLIEGKLNIYYNKNELGDHFYIEKEKGHLIEIEYFEEIREKDGVKYNFKSKKHFGILKLYTQDAPNLVTFIDSIKKPTSKNLIKLAELYHNSICNKEKCIIYEKKLPPFKFNPEIQFSKIASFNNTSNNFEFLAANAINLNLNVWMPNISEKLYFRTGIYYISGLDMDGDKINQIYSIPFFLNTFTLKELYVQVLV